MKKGIVYALNMGLHLGVKELSIDKSTNYMLSGLRNKKAVIDVNLIVRDSLKVASVLKKILQAKGNILFIEPRREHGPRVKQIARKYGCAYYTGPYAPGILMNFNNEMKKELPRAGYEHVGKMWKKPDLIIVADTEYCYQYVETATVFGITSLVLQGAKDSSRGKGYTFAGNTGHVDSIVYFYAFIQVCLGKIFNKDREV